jgi:hypothetical protein
MALSPLFDRHRGPLTVSGWWRRFERRISQRLPVSAQYDDFRSVSDIRAMRIAGRKKGRAMTVAIAPG